MTARVSVTLTCGTMREVAYMLLTAALAKSSLAFPVLDLVVKAHSLKVSSKAKQSLRVIIAPFFENYDSEVLVFRLERIQQLVLISLYVSATKNPPDDIKVYAVHGKEPSIDWNGANDRELIYVTYCNRYGAFNASFAGYSYGMLCERLRLLCQEYKKHAIEDFGGPATPDRPPTRGRPRRPWCPPRLLLFRHDHCQRHPRRFPSPRRWRGRFGRRMRTIGCASSSVNSGRFRRRTCAR
jgi:hypothetical protein